MQWVQSLLFDSQLSSLDHSILELFAHDVDLSMYPSKLSNNDSMYCGRTSERH